MQETRNKTVVGRAGSNHNRWNNNSFAPPAATTTTNISFKIVIKKVERPFSERSSDEFNWICESLGFFEPIDKDKTAASIFKEIVSATENGQSLTSTAIAEVVGMSRGAAINHLNNLMRSGLVVRNGRYYSARSRSVFRTIEEIEEDIERLFMKMKRAAREIDEEFGIAPRTKNEE